MVDGRSRPRDTLFASCAAMKGNEMKHYLFGHNVPTPFLWCGIAILLSLMVSGTATAARCPNGIVAVGNSKYEVLSKCGDPSFEDVRSVEKIKRTGPDELTRWTVAIEELTYDFGPNRFIQIFIFENGTLTKMEQGCYGNSTEADGQNYLRKNQKAQAGDSKYEVMIKLGLPVHKERREVEKARQTATGDTFIDRIYYEEWTFDPGPNRFMQMVIFENGRVTRVDTGKYGGN